MDRIDICKEKLDNKEILTEIELEHYVIKGTHRPKPRAGFTSKEEISYCANYLNLPLSRFNEIAECPLCGKLHLYKRNKNGRV